MAGRGKLRPIEGDVCWFCKQPGDVESWMGLGLLKSTTQPVFEGCYILYHECCAVYSNGSGEVPPTGMTDDEVLRFWMHGERCSGIGLRCQLCGMRGATTGCLHGPCQQFYHYPCARARAYQGQMHFSATTRSLACDKHIKMLAYPHEAQFMGMWMEGGGSWNGLLYRAAVTQWLPHWNVHNRSFQHRFSHLLTMIPAEERKALEEKEKSVKKRKHGKRTGGGNDSDPEFRDVWQGGRQLGLQHLVACSWAAAPACTLLVMMLLLEAAGFATAGDEQQQAAAAADGVSLGKMHSGALSSADSAPNATDNLAAAAAGEVVADLLSGLKAATGDASTGPAPAESSDGAVSFSGAQFHGPAGHLLAIDSSRAAGGNAGAGGSGGGHSSLHVRRYMDVNAFMTYGRKDLSTDPTGPGESSNHFASSLLNVMQQQASRYSSSQVSISAADKPAVGQPQQLSRHNPAPLEGLGIGSSMGSPMRAAGVTAHPSVVQLYVKQPPADAMKIQPWSIVVPPAGIQQLAACQVEPSQLAAQLYSLLQATSSSQQQQAASLSSGYSGLPVDLPVRYVQGCMVAPDDPRPALINEFALKAIQDIPVGTVLGPFRSYALTQDVYLELMKTVPPDWQEQSAGQARSQAWVALLHRYTFCAKVPHLASMDPYASDLAPNPPQLYFCALSFGNLTCLANDPCLDPFAVARSHITNGQAGGAGGDLAAAA
eukprot:gene3156-3433_t